MLRADGFEDTDIIVTARRTYTAAFVNAEEKEYLVIEDNFPNGRPPLEAAGIYFAGRETVSNVCLLYTSLISLRMRRNKRELCKKVLER